MNPMISPEQQKMLDEANARISKAERLYSRAFDRTEHLHLVYHVSRFDDQQEAGDRYDSAWKARNRIGKLLSKYRRQRIGLTESLAYFTNPDTGASES